MTKELAIIEVRRLIEQNCFDPMRKAAFVTGFPLSFVCAIASRETNCRNELGDYRDGEHHGVGVMQIDIQHPIARTMRDNGEWRTNPAPLIDYGCGILEGNIASCRFGLTYLQKLKIAAAGYNCGFMNALKGHEEGDCDRYTTGGDYGEDVISRMEAFCQAIAEVSA